MSAASIDRVLPSKGTSMSREFSLLFLKSDFYPLLKAATEGVVRRPTIILAYNSFNILEQPLEAKSSSPVLPLLTPLYTAPLGIFANDTEIYIDCYRQLVQYVMTIPTLPNRLPLASLSQFSARLPLLSLHLLGPFISDFSTSLTLDSKVNLTANLLAFMPPRYSKLSAQSLDVYLQLLSVLVQSFPVNALEPPSSGDPASLKSWTEEDEEEEDDQPYQNAEDISMAASSPLPPPTRLHIDSKTGMRLQTLAAPTHITSLITASGSELVCSECFLGLGFEISNMRNFGYL